MSHFVKDTFYKERLYQLSTTSFDDDEIKHNEKKKIKELCKIPLS